MTNLYQPTDVAGQEFTRCYQIVIDNRADTPPMTAFHEERVLVSNGPDRRWPIGQCHLPYDPLTEIPILDPETGDDTGATITMAAISGLLYSAYLYAANVRDSAGTEMSEEQSA